MAQNAVKHCGYCGEAKPPSEFHRLRGGLQSWCKACKSKVAAEHYRANKQLVLREIAKCELVCANCHAVRTVQRHLSA